MSVNHNLNVTAKFIDLTSNEASQNIVDVENLRKIKLEESEFVSPNKLQVNFRDFVRHVDNGYLGVEYKFSDIIPLAKKWHVASQLWHTPHEKVILSEFIGARFPNKNVRFLDCACGTGFHALLLNELGYEVVASDIDEENTNILKEQQSKGGVSFPVKNIDWRNLSRDEPSKYECVLCLGSSITYYESWKEDTKAGRYNKADLKSVIENMHSTLASGGQLIIGFCRHYSTELSGFGCVFKEKVIDDIEYSMRWELAYDWKEKHKHWHVEILNTNHENFSYELSSYLFDLDELKSVCEEVFGLGKVELVDIDPSYYDILVICRT